jgi:hypothetical protein
MNEGQGSFSERDSVMSFNAEKAKHLAGHLRAWLRYARTTELRRVMQESAELLDKVAAQSETTQ